MAKASQLEKTILPTPESIAAAKAACLAEREQARKDGVPVTDDGRLTIPELRPLHLVLIGNAGFSLEQRVACGEAVDALVERHGLQCVLRSMRLVAAVNGFYIRVVDDEQAGA